MVIIFVDHYTVLGLPTGEKGLKVSSIDIKKAYKRKALELHPDKKPNNPNAVADFQKLQASFDILKDEYARNVFNRELMIRLRERREQFVETVVEDSFDQSDADSFVKRKMAEMRKRKRADEFEEMQRKKAEFEQMQRERAEFEEMQQKKAEFEEMRRRMSSEYEKRYSEAAPNFDREQWEKKIRREANVYRDIRSIREIYAKRSAYTLFYDILRLRKGEIYV